LSTNKERRLTNDICVESSPCWAPDGQTICFVSDKVGKPQLYLLPIQGGKAQRLQTGGNECVSPDWSIVSNKLCYSTKSNSGQYVLAVLDMKQKNPMPQIITAAAGNWEAPSWAPDGRHLVCVRSSGRNRDLYIVDSWLKSITPISQGANLALPAWAPAF
jgi:TolB protein